MTVLELVLVCLLWVAVIAVGVLWWALVDLRREMRRNKVINDHLLTRQMNLDHRERELKYAEAAFMKAEAAFMKKDRDATNEEEAIASIISSFKDRNTA